MTGKVLKLLSVVHVDFELVAAQVERSLCVHCSMAYLWEWQNLFLLWFHSKECGFFTFCCSDPDGDKVLGTFAFDVASLWQILPTVTLPGYVVIKKK